MATNSDKNARRQRALEMQRARDKEAARGRVLTTIGIVVALVAVIAAVLFIVQPWNSDDSGDNTAMGEQLTPANAENGLVVNQASLGGDQSSDTKPVPVVIWEDFQCPACNAFETATKDVVRSLIENGTITVDYRPLNFIDRNMNGSTSYSQRAGSAAVCVFEDAGADAFLKFQADLFENQKDEGTDGFSNDEYIDMASDAGANDSASCIQDQSYAQYVIDMTEKFYDAGYNSTPTVLINGQVQSIGSAEEFQNAVASASAELNGGGSGDSGDSAQDGNS